MIAAPLLLVFFSAAQAAAPAPVPNEVPGRYEPHGVAGWKYAGAMPQEAGLKELLAAALTPPTTPRRMDALGLIIARARSAGGAAIQSPSAREALGACAALSAELLNSGKDARFRRHAVFALFESCGVLTAGTMLTVGNAEDDWLRLWQKFDRIRRAAQTDKDKRLSEAFERYAVDGKPIEWEKARSKAEASLPVLEAAYPSKKETFERIWASARDSDRKRAQILRDPVRAHYPKMTDKGYARFLAERGRAVNAVSYENWALVIPYQLGRLGPEVLAKSGLSLPAIRQSWIDLSFLLP